MAWAHMALEGGFGALFGVTFHAITKDAAFYTSI
jgi:hypothetical protein